MKPFSHPARPAASPQSRRLAVLPHLLALLLLAWTTGQAAAADRPGIPLLRAHAHNDYEHPRPLVDALAQGFCSIEADVHLVNGVLLVGHDLKDTRPDRNLGNLYLEPLRQRARMNGGRVFRNGPTVTLLVDIKSEATASYLALHEMLRYFADILTTFSDPAPGADPRAGRIVTNAVTVIISGNRAIDFMRPQAPRYAAVDGRPSDLDTNPPASLVPLISADWKSLFQWVGEGPMVAAEATRLREMVAKAHAQGRRIRFWGTPDRIEVWRELHNAGVDLINTDNLTGLGQFLRNPTAK